MAFFLKCMFWHIITNELMNTGYAVRIVQVGGGVRMFHKCYVVRMYSKGRKRSVTAIT